MHDDRKNRIQGSIAAAEGIADSAERSRKYRNIVGILSFEAARSDDPWFLEEAVRIVGLVTEDRSKAYVEIIKAMAKIGVNRKDEKTLNGALRIAERIDNSLDLSVALHELAVAFARYGTDRKDEQTFSYSLELIKRIPLDTYRSSAFRNISRLLIGSNPERANELLETAIELIEKSKTEPAYLVFAFCDIAFLLAKFNDERIYDFIKRAITLADGIVDDFEKSSLLLKIVETEIAVGTQRNDNGLMKESVRISKGITREYYKTLALEAIKGLD